MMILSLTLSTAANFGIAWTPILSIYIVCMFLMGMGSNMSSVASVIIGKQLCCAISNVILRFE